MDIILDLCGGTGAWSAPYKLRGYHVIIVDPLALATPNNWRVPVEEFAAMYHKFPEVMMPGVVRGVLAAPPCTEFAGSGARWWKDKDPGLIANAVAVVNACLDIVMDAQLQGELRWWCMENPVGRMRSSVDLYSGLDIGKPKMTFHPHEYAGWIDWPEDEAYTKRTCLWGLFNEPVKIPVPPNHPPGKSPIHQAPDSKDRWKRRSITPSGFAKAFARANP